MGGGGEEGGLMVQVGREGGSEWMPWGFGLRGVRVFGSGGLVLM